MAKTRKEQIEGLVEDLSALEENKADKVMLSDFGGRNYILESNKYHGNNAWYSYGYAWNFLFYVDLKGGETYTISVPVRNNASATSRARIIVSGISSSTQSIAPLAERVIKYTFTYPEDQDQVLIRFLTDSPGLPVLEWGLPKLEKGSVPTDWTPAFEDFISDYNETDATKFSFIKNLPDLSVYLQQSDIADYALQSWVNSNFATTNEINNIYDLLSAKANDRLSNVASNLSQSEKNALLDKIGGNFRDYGLGQGQISAGTWDLSSSYSGFVSANDHGGAIGQSSGRLWGFRTSYGSTTYGVALAMRNGRAAFQTRENGTDSGWLEFWHTGNFNPAQYVLQSDLNTQLANYVTISGTQTIGGTKTFTNAPIVPNGTLNGHTVNLGQLNDKLGEKADIDGSNTTGGSWNIDELGSTVIGSYSTVYALDNSVVGINPTNALGVSPGILLMKQGFPIVIAENENPDWDGYIYRAGTPKPGYPGNQQNGNYLIESKHRFRFYSITSPDSTSGTVGFLTIQPYNAIEHSYYRVTFSGLDIAEIDMKAPQFDELTDLPINRNPFGQKCSVAVSGNTGDIQVKFTNVSGINFSNHWKAGVFIFYFTEDGWVFGGYSPIET